MSSRYCLMIFFVTFAFFSGFFVTSGSFCMFSLMLLCSHCRCVVMWCDFVVILCQIVSICGLYVTWCPFIAVFGFWHSSINEFISHKEQTCHATCVHCIQFYYSALGFKKCNISARWDSISLHSAPTNWFTTGTNKGRTPKDDVQKTYVVLNRWAIQPHYYSVESYSVAPFNGRNIISCFWSRRALEKDS